MENRLFRICYKLRTNDYLRNLTDKFEFVIEIRVVSIYDKEGDNMSITEEFELYTRELKLILKQNPIECELYSVIAALLRRRKNMELYSLRDVSARRKSTIGNKFLTEAGFPDFAIMTIEEEPKMIGVVEIKRLVVNLDNEDKQVKKHRYRENDTERNPLVVLYTNGLEWRLYAGEGEFGEINDKRISLGKVNENNIDWEEGCENKEWNCLIELLEGIDWTGAVYKK